jgi:hypothetical protein
MGVSLGFRVEVHGIWWEASESPTFCRFASLAPSGVEQQARVLGDRDLASTIGRVPVDDQDLVRVRPDGIEDVGDRPLLVLRRNDHGHTAI